MLSMGPFQSLYKVSVKNLPVKFTYFRIKELSSEHKLHLFSNDENRDLKSRNDKRRIHLRIRHFAQVIDRMLIM